MILHKCDKQTNDRTDRHSLYMRPMPTTLALGKINVSYRASYLLGLGKALIFIFIVNLNNRPPKLILSLVHIALTVLD